MTTPSFAHHGEGSGKDGPTLAEVASWPATVDVPAAARALGISERTAYYWIRAGEFPARVISVRHRHRVVTASLLAVLSGTAG